MPTLSEPISARSGTQPSSSRSVYAFVILAGAAANCLFQIAWFWRFHSCNINMDGIQYIGLARHLVDGNWKTSLHGYWSPLTSWIIAAGALFTRNFLLIGHVATIASFLFCLPLIYVLSWRLWRSSVAAALAVFWFSFARGIAATAVGSILADFVLTACVLLYFIVLLKVLRSNDSRSWLLLGAAHGLAFLAKAIAMPWLAVATLAAAVVRNAREPRRIVSAMLLAFILPAAVWVGWGMTLRMKYGVFTSGYQLRANLRINWMRQLSHWSPGASLQLADVSSTYDEYMVGETSWSQLQSFHLRNAVLLPMIVNSEMRNLPGAAKEITILLTPGGVLAFIALLFALARERNSYLPELLFTMIVLISGACVIGAYCMLVFDGRYVIPLAAVLMAIASPALLPSALSSNAPRMTTFIQRASLALFVASLLFFSVYWASPFRTSNRDYEASCYSAAGMLRSAKPHGTLVSIGNGPFPEHGLGFESGPYLAYFAGWREVAGNDLLPEINGIDGLVHQVLAIPSDAIAVWGSPNSARYRATVERLEHDLPNAYVRQVRDPEQGEVGTLIVRQ